MTTPITPRNNSEKLRVLKDARNLLSIGHARGMWFKMIDGIEAYCLYGAIEEAMGRNVKSRVKDMIMNDEFCDPDLDWESDAEYAIDYNSENQTNMFHPDDLEVDACSLTSTMFRAWLDTAPTDRIEKWSKGSQYQQNLYTDAIRGLEYGTVVSGTSSMRYILQSENDDNTQKAILAVVDKAIENLEALVAAE